jgi:hypothetical protein
VEEEGAKAGAAHQISSQKFGRRKARKLDRAGIFFSCLRDQGNGTEKKKPVQLRGESGFLRLAEHNETSR